MSRPQLATSLPCHNLSPARWRAQAREARETPEAAEHTQLYFDTASDKWLCDRKVAGRPLFGALFIDGFVAASDRRASAMEDGEEELDEDEDVEDRLGGEEDELVGGSDVLRRRSPEEEEAMEEEQQEEEEQQQ